MEAVSAPEESAATEATEEKEAEAEALGGDAARARARAADRLYLFGHGAYDAMSLAADFDEPSLFVDPSRWRASEAERAAGALWYAGPAGSGVSLHMHTSAWNALVSGRKRWYLLPPLTVWGPTDLPTAEWVRTVYPEMRRRGDPVHECTQEEGEVMWVPGDWYHATLNVEPSTGIAIEVGSDVKLLDESLAAYSYY